jgi:large subunit ribosomal protein L10
MRAEKQFLTQEYLGRLNASPFFLAVDYTGLKVSQLTTLRRQLAEAGAELHVVKNTVFRHAAKQAGIELTGPLEGPVAVVTGKKDVTLAAKALKTFAAAEQDKPKIRFGYLNNQRLDASMILALADLPSREVLQAKLLGLLQAPATKLVALLNTPASQLARVLQAKAQKGDAPAAA